MRWLFVVVAIELAMIELIGITKLIRIELYLICGLRNSHKIEERLRHKVLLYRQWCAQMVSYI